MEQVISWSRVFMKAKQETKGDGKHRLAFLTWVGVYPVLTGIALALEPILSGHSIPVRTFVMSILMVPIMVYAVMPMIRAMFFRK